MLGSREDIVVRIKEGIIVDVLHSNLRKILHVGAVDGKASLIFDVTVFVNKEKVIFLLCGAEWLWGSIIFGAHLGTELLVNASELGEDLVFLLRRPGVAVLVGVDDIDEHQSI